MVDPLFRAIPVEYGRLYMRDSFIDAQDLGVSLHGLGKLANAIVHFYLHGQVPRDSRLYQVKVFVGPPKAGSVLYDVMAMMVTGQLPLYAPLLCEVAEKYIPTVFRAVINLAVGRRPNMEKIIDQLIGLSAGHDAFAKQVHEGHMLDKAWMREHITKLADQGRAPLRELVKPIGSSCREIKVGNESVTEPAVMDEPEAEVLSSKEKLEVGDMRQFRATFDAVDTITGTCKLRVDGSDLVVRGKITDPALANVQNVYTHSLDTKRSIVLTAKPVTKDGEIVRLFISDGHPITDTGKP